MSRAPRLILFDVDGTLVDSQASIVGAMTVAFADSGLPAPKRDAILAIVGLSLDRAMAVLAPDVSAAGQAALVAGYRSAFLAACQQQGAAHSPLYPGTRAALETLAAVPGNLIGVATGKSRRGLDGLIEAHGLGRFFVTRQVADHHPSKPHPSMILAALEETGVDPGNAVMIGDTRFDMEMARAAGIAGVGVSWGYHAPANLGASHGVVDSFGALVAHLDRLWERAA